MGRVILCIGNQAKIPYYFEKLGIQVWSVEELCYYLYKNLHLADDSLMNQGLCTWLGQELGMKELAGKRMWPARACKKSQSLSKSEGKPARFCFQNSGIYRVLRFPHLKRNQSEPSGGSKSFGV